MWRQEAVYQRRRRTFAVSAALALLLLIILASSSGGGNNGPAAPRVPVASTQTLPQSPAPLSTQTITPLLAPIRQAAAAEQPGGGGFYVIGGLDSAGTSSAGIATVSPVNGPSFYGELPSVSLNAATAVELDHAIYIFGGEDGQTPEDTIYDFSGGEINPEGVTLPAASFGMAATVLNGNVYLIGGYNGQTNLTTILSWHPGVPVTVAGTLPGGGLRYAAAAAIDGEIVIAGGATPTGVSKQVYLFNPANKKVQALAQLPSALEWASAGTLGDLVYVIGGEPGPETTPVNTIYSIDPISKQVSNAGTLPEPLAEAAEVELGGNTIYLSGGYSGTAALTSIYALTVKTG